MRQPPVPVRLAALIADLERAGMSRTEIAAAVGLSRQSIWHLAAGMARAPSYATVAAIEALAARRLSPAGDIDAARR